MHESKHIGKGRIGNYYAHCLAGVILFSLYYLFSYISYGIIEVFYCFLRSFDEKFTKRCSSIPTAKPNIKVFIFFYILFIFVDNLGALHFHFQQWPSAVHAKQPGAHWRLMIALHLPTLLVHIFLGWCLQRKRSG